MLKSILNVGSELTKSEQKSINGGRQLLKVLVCTAHTIGQNCGPSHCPGECGWFNGEPHCWSY